VVVHLVGIQATVTGEVDVLQEQADVQDRSPAPMTAHLRFDARPAGRSVSSTLLNVPIFSTLVE
jgi:hypothetical protein